ncbi:reverse transcriptase domain-containing protein [Weissella muntiaci]|nr:reverse transcriptase domain-containing protein [Weissella muntiaci]
MIDESRIDEYYLSQNNFWHFDFRIPKRLMGKYISYIQSPKNIANYRFYPFIRYYKVLKKNDGEKIHIKKRPITVASHHDGIIYKYYGEILSLKYEEFLSTRDLNDTVTAYMKSDAKVNRSNTYSAKEVFKTISDYKDAYIIKGDFKGFFDNLDWMVLRSQVSTILGTAGLTDDWESVLKSLTDYRVVEDEYLRKIMINELSPNGARFKNRKALGDFVKKRKKISHRRIFKHNVKGIPQGTALSAILANVYMLEFDQSMMRLMKDLNGMYRRYSDDFIIILPRNGMDDSKISIISDEIINMSESMLGLTIEKSKTRLLYYNGTEMEDVKLKRRTTLSYLGYQFDGLTISLRSKSIYKFVYRGKKATNYVIRDEHDIKKVSTLSIREIDEMPIYKYKYNEVYGLYRVLIQGEEADHRRKLYREVKSRLLTSKKFYVKNKNVSKYLVHRVEKQRNLLEFHGTFMDYAVRSDRIMGEIGNGTKSVILKQTLRVIGKNQRRLAEAREKINAWD